MSEMKRVAFTTLGSDLSTARRSSSGSFSAAALFQDDEAAMLPPSTLGATGPSSASTAGVTSQGQGTKTFRLELELFDPNADSFPEFFYPKLVHAEKKKIKKLSKSNGFIDAFDENDDDVARIAKEFEKKYSGTYAGKGRRGRKDDYYDKGAGYDESDSFIDNTEAYDEIIPEEVETVGGGFYINSGALEFTHLMEDDNIKATKTRKRAISSSSSEGDGDGNGKDGKEKQKEIVEETIEKDVPPKESSSSNVKTNVSQSEKKSKVLPDDVTIDQTTKIPKPCKDVKFEKVKPKDVEREPHSESGVEKEKDKEKVVKTTTVKDMLKAKRDNFRKMKLGEDSSKPRAINGVKLSDSEESSGTATDSEVETEPPDKKRRKSIEGDDGEKVRTSDPGLPAELSEELLRDVEELKNISRQSNPVGKPFHFTDQMIEVFLRIDDACSGLDKSIRNQVFAHLEYQLSLAKYYFLQKARRLRIKQEKNKTKRVYLKLKKAVAEVMPSILTSYESSCRKVDEMWSIATQTNNDNVELPKYPRKKFIWNDSIRNLLYDLYQVRWTSFLVLRTRKEALNDFITNYLKEKVVPIWPQGWMKYEELKKELEKRKKPKDNKKGEDEMPSTSTKRNLEMEKISSVLSSSSNASVISMKNLVVTISTKSDKKTEVPLSNSDCLTVTPIPTESSGGSSKSASISKNSDSSHQKLAKGSTSSSAALSLVTSDRRSTSPLNLNQNSSAAKSGHISQSSHSTANKYTAEDHPTNSSNSHSSQTASKKSHSSVTLDLTSPHRRATDHSINSIMSSRTTPSPTNHSSNNSNTSQSSVGGSSNPPTATKNSSGTTPSDTAITHVITLDNLKNTSDIISTSNKLISSNPPVTTASSSNSTVGSSAAASNGTIRIRSVASVNSCLVKEKEKERRKDVALSFDHVRPSSRNSSGTIEDANLDIDSDSDGVEIVGVFPVSSKKRKHMSSSLAAAATIASSSSLPPQMRPSNKHKEKKVSSNNSRSSSPSVVQISKRELGSKSSSLNSRYNDLEHSLKDRRVPTAAEIAVTAAAGADKDNELDVFQIMQALKELETITTTTNMSSEPLEMQNHCDNVEWRLVNEYFKSFSGSEPDRSFQTLENERILPDKKQMQQSSIHISSSKSPTNSRPGGGSHASPINYI